ncbi:hypothetical protein PG991_007039 [Apiospora marii]|uniref:Extracellular membrane protein CFEM domain-containing protein n=1 Tax=Apiospora marii TaxID=335849 RepID=A0ABR1RZ71_9PEZI
MRISSSTWLSWLAMGGWLAVATDVVYVTDLTIFTELAPCAASALSYNIMSMTYSACPQAVTDLQSCVCSKGSIPSSVQFGISNSVSYSCGSTATDDQASASSAFAAYCNQANITPFPKPTQPVSQYIMDFPEWAELAPCAASAVSLNVMSMTYDLCPTDASLLAPCVCNKNQNSLRVSQAINTSVKSSCSAHTADVSSAQALFAAYCALNNGTTAFPTPSDPPGDMTYYVNGMAEYKSLAPCAQSALSSGILSCRKRAGNPIRHHRIRYVNPTRGTLQFAHQAVQQTWPPGRTGSNSGPRPTGTDANSNSSSSSSSADASKGTKSNVTIIASAVVGVILGLGAIGAVLFYFMWRRRHAQGGNQEEACHIPTMAPDNGSGKPELDSTAIAVMAEAGSPSVSSLRPASPPRADNVSPVYAHGEGHYSPLKPELSSTPMARQHPGLQGNHGPSSQTHPPVPEAYGQPLHEAPGQAHGDGHVAPPNHTNQQHMGWQSGPVHEMDGGYGGDGGGHH